MAHGAPDHRLVIDLVELVKLINKIDEITTIAEITDLKNIDSVDLVDRITRIDSIDSLGEISIAKVVPLISPPLLLFDDFDSGVLKWTPYGDGRLELSNTRAFSGSGSLRIHTGPSTGESETAKRKFAVSADLTMRAVVRFAMPSSGASGIHLFLTRYTPAQTLHADVGYSVSLKKWVYTDKNGAPQDVPGGSQDLKLDPDVWHRAEFEVDFSTKKFVQLKVDALTMDMSGIDLYDTGNPDSEHAEIGIIIMASTGQVVDGYIDDCYVEAW